MILGMLLVVFGNILIWGSDEETTQFFSGWVIGILSISVAPSLPRIPRLALASVACVFIVANEQTLTTPPSEITCVNGEVRILDGVKQCICTPPYVGDACTSCARGAIIESGVNGTDAVCNTCRHQYMYPHCNDFLPGYHNETMCYDRWVPSCLNVNSVSLPLLFPKTYENAEGVRASLYDVSESMCINLYSGTVYCDKCKDGHAGPDCCPDGKYGQDCKEDVPVCNADMDYQAKLRPNVIPTGYNLVDPKICYNDNCTCGGEFIGDTLCASNYCVEGKCSDLSRTTQYDFRCQCDVGVGPDCVTPPCYGGTRMWDGKGICRCNAKHTDSYNGLTFDACEKQTDGQCYPDLFGDQCKECQCVVNVTDPLDTFQCGKTHYGVFERDFRTKDFTGSASGCIDSGICTNEPDDCGVVEEGADRCLLFTNPQTFSAILFSGNNCTNTADSKCAVYEPCRPR